MKRIVKIVFIVLVIAFAVLQFVRPDTRVPPIVLAEELSLASVPPDVGAIFQRSCADCHTYSTRYPWYSQISPFSWFLAGHIEDGRRKLNLSIWNTYTNQKKAKKLGEMCEQVEEGKMPLPSYLWIHRDAALTPDDVRILCGWTQTEAAKLEN